MATRQEDQHTAEDQNPILTDREKSQINLYSNPAVQKRVEALRDTYDKTSAQIRKGIRPFIPPRFGFDKHCLGVEDMFILANPENLRIGFSGYQDDNYTGSFRNVTSSSW